MLIKRSRSRSSIEVLLKILLKSSDKVHHSGWHWVPRATIQKVDVNRQWTRTFKINYLFKWVPPISGKETENSLLRFYVNTLQLHELAMLLSGIVSATSRWFWNCENFSIQIQPKTCVTEFQNLKLQILTKCYNLKSCLIPISRPLPDIYTCLCGNMLATNCPMNTMYLSTRAWGSRVLLLCFEW